MAHCKACDYTYYRARGLGSDRGPKAEKLERPSPQKYELFAIPSSNVYKWNRRGMSLRRQPD